MPHFQSLRATTALIAALALSAAHADTFDKLKVSKTIYLGYRTSDTPFSFVNKAGEPTGFAVDLCRHFAAALSRELKLPLQLTWVPVGPNERNAALADGLIDIDCADSTVTNQSMKEVSFTIPIFVAATRLLVPGVQEGTDLGRFHGQKLVTTSQSGNEAMLRHVLRQTGVSADVVVARTPKAAMEVLKKGQAKALFADDATLFSLRLGFADAGYSVLPKTYSLRPKALTYRKEEPRLRALMSREMRDLIGNGSLAKWHEQWLNAPLPDSGINLATPISYLLRETWKNPSDSFVDYVYGDLPD